MNYRCCDCGAVFSPENAGTHNEIYRLDGQTFAEPWAACPECGSTDLEDVGACPICEEWSRQGACRLCKKEIREDLNKIMDKASTSEGKEAILDEIQEFVEGY